jgi:hypothetical protein
MHSYSILPLFAAAIIIPLVVVCNNIERRYVPHFDVHPLELEVRDALDMDILTEVHFRKREEELHLERSLLHQARQHRYETRDYDLELNMLSDMETRRRDPLYDLTLDLLQHARIQQRSLSPEQLATRMASFDEALDLLHETKLAKREAIMADYYAKTGIADVNKPRKFCKSSICTPEEKKVMEKTWDQLHPAGLVLKILLTLSGSQNLRIKQAPFH